MSSLIIVWAVGCLFSFVSSLLAAVLDYCEGVKVTKKDAVKYSLALSLGSWFTGLAAMWYIVSFYYHKCKYD